jgi:cilia- and flagella-associated protein 69
VLETLVELLYDYRNQTRLVHSLLDLVSFMMLYSRLADELCKRGVLHLVMEIMLVSEDFRSNLIRTGFEIFWSAIEEVGVECLVALGSQEYVSGLQRLLVRVVKEGYKLEDKCLRNEIVILINYLLSLPECIPLFLARQ